MVMVMFPFSMIWQIQQLRALTTSDSDVIRGQSVTVSWTTQYTQFISRLEVSGGGIAAIDVTGQSSITLQPQQTEDWRLTAFYAGGSHARQTTQVVYIPPVVTMTSNPNPIPLGLVQDWNGKLRVMLRQ